MIEIIIIALAGSIVAGIWDLFTTEVPDEIPYLMITAGIFFWYIISGMNGDLFPLFISLAGGTLLLIFGLVLYHKGKWGGADAWLLAAIAYMIPVYEGQIFILSFILNMVFVSMFYMAIYSVALGIKNKSVFAYFIKDLKKNKLTVAAIPLGFLILSAVLVFSFADATALFINNLILTFIAVVLLTFFWRYAHAIEGHIFIKRIQSKDLKAGDVLAETNWIGLTEDEIREIRKRKKYVTIKDGVRFVPVFAITLAVTLLWGNMLFFIY